MSLSQPCLTSNHRLLAHLLAHRPADNKGEKNQLAMGACDRKGEGGKAMAMGIWVAGDEEGKGDEAGDGVGN